MKLPATNWLQQKKSSLYLHKPPVLLGIWTVQPVCGAWYSDQDGTPARKRATLLRERRFKRAEHRPEAMRTKARRLYAARISDSLACETPKNALVSLWDSRTTEAGSITASSVLTHTYPERYAQQLKMRLLPVRHQLNPTASLARQLFRTHCPCNLFQRVIAVGKVAAYDDHLASGRQS